SVHRRALHGAHARGGRLGRDLDPDCPDAGRGAERSARTQLTSPFREHGPPRGRFAAVLPLSGAGEEEVRSSPSMDAFVFAAVLFAAACHAGWNAAIKRGLDPLVTTVLISLGAGVVALALVPFAG